MKRTAILVSVALLTALWVTPAEVHGQSIVGSKHDFSGASWNTGLGSGGTGEICQVCHTPHNSDTGITDAPLWNHQTTTASFTPYTSTAMNAAPGQPSGASKLCLSCHDGTVALDNFNGTTNGSTTMSGAPLISTDLGNDHPISFDYTASLASADGELYDPTTTDLPNGKATELGGTIANDLLFSNQVQCATCHDVHDSGNETLLTISNVNSNLCLTCHKK